MSDNPKQRPAGDMTLTELQEAVSRLAEETRAYEVMRDAVSDMGTALSEAVPLLQKIAEKKTALTLPPDSKVGSSWEIDMGDGRKFTITRKS